MNWKHLKSAERSTETDSQSMSVTQAGKVVKFLVVLVAVVLVVALVMVAVGMVVALMVAVAADSQRMRDQVALALLIFGQGLVCSQIPNQDKTFKALPIFHHQTQA